MAKIYGAFGWEYRKPIRVPPSCPYNQAAAAKKDSNLLSQEDSVAPHPVEKPPSEVDNMVELSAKDKAA